jgi:translation initiation factor IF-3
MMRLGRVCIYYSQYWNDKKIVIHRSLRYCTVGAAMDPKKQSTNRTLLVTNTQELRCPGMMITNKSIINIGVSSSSFLRSTICNPIPQFPRRFFAKNASQRNTPRSANEPLSNEALISRLMQLKQASTATDVQVRIVPDKQSNQSDPPVVMTLQEAIQKSIDTQLDLIAISMDQEIPVLIISNLSAMMYRDVKKNKGKKANPASITKEVTFRTGIAEHDHQRKIDDIQKFIEKQFVTSVTIRAKRKHLAGNPNICNETAQQVWKQLSREDARVPCEMHSNITMNEELTMAQFMVRPKSQKHNKHHQQQQQNTPNKSQNSSSSSKEAKETTNAGNMEESTEEDAVTA